VFRSHPDSYRDGKNRHLRITAERQAVKKGLSRPFLKASLTFSEAPFIYLKPPFQFLKDPPQHFKARFQLLKPPFSFLGSWFLVLTSPFLFLGSYISLPIAVQNYRVSQSPQPQFAVLILGITFLA